MKLAKITSGGQFSIPASIRHRWGTRTVSVEDLGDRMVIKPLPDDPIAAARGALQGRVKSTAKLRRQAREDEDEADAQARH